MRLIALELENVRKFDRPHRVDGFGPGINVLAGPNEHGKSTLLLALHAVLFLRHGSRDRAVTTLRPFGHETAPRVALRFALDNGVEAALDKRFLGRPQARLALDEARFEGDAAETRLRALLGLEHGPAARGADPGIWEALLVVQGTAAEQPALGGPNEAATVLRCLEAELGAVTGSGRADTVLADAERLLNRHRDRNGRPRERARLLAERLAAIETEAAALAGRAIALADDGTRLAEHEAALARVRAGLADLTRARVLDGARAEREAARGREADLGRLRAECAAAAGARTTTAARLDERRRLAAAAAAAAETARHAAAAACAAVARHDTASTDAGVAATRLAACRATEHAARVGLDGAERAVTASAGRAALQSRSALLARARAAADRVREAEARLASLPVDATRLRLLRTAADRLARARDDRRARAGTLRFEPAPGAPTVWLERDGLSPAPLGPELTVSLDEAVALRIEAVGRVVLRPAELAGADAVAGARAALDRLLAEAGVPDADAAERAAVARADAAVALDDARRTVLHLVPGDAAADLAPGVDALASLVARLRAELRGVAPWSDGSADLEPDAAPDDRVALGAARDAARATLAEAEIARREADSEAAAASLRAATAERDAAAAAREAANARRTALAAADALTAVSAGADGETLAAASAAAERQHEAAAGALAGALAGAAGAPDLAMLDARIARLEEERANDEADHNRLTADVAGLRARIEAAGGSGLDEQRAGLERERAVLEREAAAIDEEVAALTLLLATLRDTSRAARDAVLAPLRRRTATALRRLLPGAMPALDDDGAVAALDRGDGRAAEPFAALSHGTREQIAVLTRLALADLLRAAGRPALLVLDDALVFADEARIDRMFDILREAAERVQIVVLTCRADLFDRLGGTRLRIEPVFDGLAS